MEQLEPHPGQRPAGANESNRCDQVPMLAETAQQAAQQETEKYTHRVNDQ